MENKNTIRTFCYRKLSKKKKRRNLASSIFFGSYKKRVEPLDDFQDTRNTKR